MKAFLSSTRNRVIVIFVAVAVVVAAIVGGTAVFYQSHALPGSTVGNVAVGGMTRDEIAQAVQKAADSATLTVKTSEGDVTATMAEAGLTVDVNKTVDAVLANPVWNIFSSPATDPTVTVNDETEGAFVKSLPRPEHAEPVNATVSFDGGSEQFVVKEGSSGQSIDAEGLRKSFIEATQTLQDATVEANLVVLEPAVTAEKANAAADTANKWLNVPVTVTDEDDDSETADSPTKAEWVSFVEEGDTFVPKVDAEKAKAWVASYAKHTEKTPTTGLRNVDGNGNEVAISMPASDGWKVTNTGDIVEKITASMTSGSAVDGVFNYAVDEAKWEDRPALEGTEGLVYRPAAGEKWIDLNVDGATVTAYEGADVVGGPFYMVPGAPATPTERGSFNVHLQYEVQTMRGENADGSNYVTEGVPWITYFFNGYAFHGAPWRSSFGWTGAGGSHGCVNMPVGDAKFIYEWADIGTKVISH